ncbi:MAG: hypothetical protein E7509_00660 [Ruminococcus sp.]|nr:hypothetical protein [Ruminococcus sp.]
MTEYLVVAIVVFVLLYIIGGSILTVAGLSLLLVVISMGVFGFFVYSLTLLFKTKRKNAKFLNFSINKKYKFKTAVYLIDNEEYENIFPAESMIFKRFYEKSRTVKVYCFTNKNKVFDKLAVITTLSGVISGALLVAFTVFFFIGVLRF